MSTHAASVLILAATSKTPFYVAGGIAALWAVLVSAFGISRPDWPGSKAGRTGVIGVSFVIVVAAMATAVITASTEKPASAESPKPSSQPAQGGGGGGNGGAVALAANPAGSLRFDKKQVRVAAGRVTIDFTNDSSIP